MQWCKVENYKTHTVDYVFRIVADRLKGNSAISSCLASVLIQQVAAWISAHPDKERETTPASGPFIEHHQSAPPHFDHPYQHNEETNAAIEIITEGARKFAVIPKRSLLSMGTMLT